MTTQQVCELAMSLDGAAEREIRAAGAEWAWCEEVWWGRRLSAVAVLLAECDPEAVVELVQDAWRRHL